MIRLIVAGVSYCVSLILICHCLLTCPIFTLLPSVFFILKAHRDLSLNVICAIQAWFIISIIIFYKRAHKSCNMHTVDTTYIYYFNFKNNYRVCAKKCDLARIARFLGKNNLCHKHDAQFPHTTLQYVR